MQIGLATIGVCIFGAVTSVAALFYYQKEGTIMSTSLRQASKDFAIQQHQHKSDDDLRAIIAHNGLVAQSTFDELELEKLLGEQEGCVAILRWRENEEIRKQNEACAIEEALENWQSTIADRKKRAMLNLPTATSYHGQLVVAVLEEEDNLGADEIRQWADDLTAMSDSEYIPLLKGLVAENILSLDSDGKYFLLTPCTPDLRPTNPIMFLEQVYGYIDYTLQDFLELLIQTGKPATENDWLALKGNYQAQRSPYAFDQRGFEGNFRSAKRKLREYVNEGILSIMPIPGTDLNFYDFAMLGEKEEN